MAKTLNADEIVESHKLKNFKYKFIFKNDDIIKELESLKYDISSTDTINNDDLTQAALNASYQYYERNIIGKSKEPTMMDKGVIISKKMVTKADKKLLKIGIGFFNHDDIAYVSIRLVYEQFDIIEIFILANQN